MKRSLFNSIVKDKTVREIDFLRTEDGRNILETPWIRREGMEPGGNPEDWDDKTTSLIIRITLPEYRFLKTARRINAEMALAREAQKKPIHGVHYRRRDAESSS